MIIPAELTELFEKMVINEVERRMKKFSAHVVIDGELVHANVCVVSTDKVFVGIETPLYFIESGETGFIIKETDKMTIRRKCD